MDRYRQMKVFDAVAQAGSLAAAARCLNVSPALIGRSVAALEARLNAVLLLRSSRGTRLSAAGEQFAGHCRLILQGIEQAQHSVAGLQASAAGTLTVALPQQLAHPLFMPIALDYLESFPAVQLVMRHCESPPKLLEEGIDIALVVGHLADFSGFAVPIGKAQPMLCAAPQYLAQHGRPQSPADLGAHRSIITTSAGQADWRFQCHTSAARASALHCTTQQAAITAAVCGLGLARCMHHEVYPQLQAGLLEPVLQAYAPSGLPMHLVYREGRRATARVRSFIDFALPRLRSHPILAA